jgi:hypothetical protein
MSQRNCGPFIAISFVMLVAVCNWGCGGGGSRSQDIYVNASSSAQTIDEGRSAAITATVTNDMSGKGVTWTLSGTGCSGTACGALSNQTPSSVTYTAPGSVTANLSVQVLATSVADSGESAPVLLTVVPPPSVTTTSLPGITAGGVYNTALQVSGGVSPYSWSINSGSLPTGLSLSSDGTISGTSCTGSTSKFTVQVADSATPPLTGSAPLSISVTVVPLSISTTSLPNGVTDTIYNQQVQVAGGVSPYTWSVASGSLPTWASLNSTTGSIAGIPGTTGTANFTLQVTESGCSALTSPSQALSISVNSETSANDSELKGQYAFLFSGFDDATGSQLAIAGSFTADGNGNITGIEDENGPNGAVLAVPLTGTYNIASNNTGAFSITTANGSKTYAVGLNSISNGVAQKARFIEFDDTTGTNGQRGSGFLRLQDTSAFSLGSITGPYAFGFSGQNATGSREAIVGAFNANGSGVISSGIADQNVAGTATNPSLTGTYTAPSPGEGRASIVLSPSGASSLNLTAYVVSTGELLVMTTAALSSDGLVSGTILTQASTSFDNTALNSPAVFYQLGVVPGSPSEASAEVGLMTPNGTNELSLNADSNIGGTITQNTTNPFNYSVANSGRVSVSSTQVSAAWILYLVDKNQAFLLDTSNAVGFGFVETQAAAPSGGFTNSSFSGTFSYNTIAPSISPNLNASGVATLDGTGNFSESMSISATSGLSVNQTSTGSYTINGNGRGTVTSLVMTTAGVRGSLGALLLLPCLLLGRLLSRQKPRVSVLTAFLLLFFLAFLFAPAGSSMRRPPQNVNQLVFYMISPGKAIIVHEGLSDAAPGITIIEQ